MKLRKIQAKHWEWAKKNFGKPPAHQPLLGALEELGELAHSHIKAEQGIRGSKEDHDAAGIDAVADILLFLMQYCSIKGWDMQDLLEGTAKEVWERDWVRFPETGYPDSIEDLDEDDIEQGQFGDLNDSCPMELPDPEVLVKDNPLGGLFMEFKERLDAAGIPAPGRKFLEGALKDAATKFPRIRLTLVPDSKGGTSDEG